MALDDDWETKWLDTLVVSAPRVDSFSYSRPVYNPSAERRVDLLHTELHLSIDWENRQLPGKAIIELTPYYYPINTLEIDAKKMDIKNVQSPNIEISNVFYDSSMLFLALQDTLYKGDTIQLEIDYVANPNAPVLPGPNASEADKGLFFIDPDGVSSQPTQIWTQGETENNSRWFPTIDKPNENTTQDIYITVADSLQTLSNGRLLSSTTNNDGTRTDHWSQLIPHAVYLSMIAVGDFYVSRETWNNIDLHYYVDLEYEESAKEIFAHTPEMLDYFSNLFDYEYPWDKYAQIAVHDFVAGAMENTGAVIFGDFVQKDKWELLDANNDKIVAHELVHHWFGNLVTCESWANLTLNEGFANYGEYLWLNHKYGLFDADEHRKDEFASYLYSTQFFGTHPLIHFSYEDKEDMFDAHSYNKGGMVLHMLRYYLGDTAFFEGIKNYLSQHEFQSVEIHDLRLIYEDLTGLDLNWFFDQWYFGHGHPSLYIDYSFDKDSCYIVVEQTQLPPESEPVFILPLRPRVYYTDSTFVDFDCVINSRKKQVSFPNHGKTPSLILADPDSYLMASINESRPAEDWNVVINLSENYQHLYNALSFSDSISRKQFEKVLAFNNATLTTKAFEKLGQLRNLDNVTTLFHSTYSSDVKVACLAYLKTHEPQTHKEIVQSLLLNEGSYRLLSYALYESYDLDSAATLDIIETQQLEKVYPLINTIAGLYSYSGLEKYNSFFISLVDNAIQEKNYAFIDQHIQLLRKSDSKYLLASLNEYFAVFEKAYSEHAKTASKNVCLVLLKDIAELVPYDELLRQNEDRLSYIQAVLAK